MFFNNNLERPDVSPNPGLNLTHLRTTGPWPSDYRSIIVNIEFGVNANGIYIRLF